MTKWIPVVASFGLICLMVLPTPGILGLVIGTSCALAILAWGALWLLDRAADRVILFGSRLRVRRRAVHAGSGIAVKTQSRRTKAAGSRPGQPPEPVRPR